MQSKFAAALLSALSLSGPALAQSLTPQPEITGGGQVVTCGGCFAVADVAAIVFGEDIFTVTQANNQIVVSSGNFTTVFTTATIERAPFTLTPPNGLVVPTDVPAVTVDFTGSEFTFGSLTLTSPTAYNLITAYSTIRTTAGSDGQCTPTTGPSVGLASVFNQSIPSTVRDLAAFQIAAESQFFANNGLPSGCSSGGSVRLTITRPAQATTVTTAGFTTTINSTLPTTSQGATTTTVSSTSATLTSTNGPFAANNISSTNPIIGQTGVTVVSPTAPLTTGATGTDFGQPTIVPGMAAVDRPSTLTALLSGLVAMIVGFVA